MPHRVTQPTKEQVRAYMATRLAARGQHASASRPPPSPEEIRALLGWRLQRGDLAPAFLQFYLIPTVYSRLATAIVCDFLLAAMSASRVATTTHKKFI
jgi:hypothetical protein